MKDDKGSRCDIARVIRCMVDESDLDEGQRRHLAECPLCGEEKRRLEGRLSRLGRMAAEYTPEPGRRVILPEEERKQPLKSVFGMRLAWGAGVSFALVILMGMWIVFHGSTSPVNYQDVVREIAEDETLMAEISVLEENPLPEAYRRISPETVSGIDEDIFDFIVPVENRDTVQGRGKEA